MVKMSFSKPHKKLDRRVMREDYAIVLDFMPEGNPMDRHHPSHRTKPIAQGLGDKYFTLLEFHPKRNVTLKQGERVCISFRFKELRDKVEYVWGEPIAYDDLSTVAKAYLPEAIKEVIKSRENVFVMFFNIAAPLTIKLHALELIPGIGKKTMWILLRERERKPFENFEDIKERGKIADPVAALTERILREIRGEERYYLFVTPPETVSNPIFLNYLEIIYRKLGIE